MIIKMVIIQSRRGLGLHVYLNTTHPSILLSTPIIYSAFLYFTTKYKSVYLLFKLKTYCLLLIIIYYLYHSACSYLSTSISTPLFLFPFLSFYPFFSLLEIISLVFLLSVCLNPLPTTSLIYLPPHYLTF